MGIFSNLLKFNLTHLPCCSDTINAYKLLRQTAILTAIKCFSHEHLPQVHPQKYANTKAAYANVNSAKQCH